MSNESSHQRNTTEILPDSKPEMANSVPSADEAEALYATARRLQETGDNDKAADCYEKAEAYATGSAGIKDWEKAVTWYAKAAARGHAKACYALGECYKLGFGVPQNQEMAKMWFQRAKEKQTTSSTKITEEPLVQTEKTEVDGMGFRWLTDGDFRKACLKQIGCGGLLVCSILGLVVSLVLLFFPVGFLFYGLYVSINIEADILREISYTIVLPLGGAVFACYFMCSWAVSKCPSLLRRGRRQRK